VEGADVSGLTGAMGGRGRTSRRIEELRYHRPRGC
jgi:hypothetical protein